jgi:uncharacterized protein
MSIEITVRGHFSTFRSPERVTVHTAVGYEGPSMEPVYQQVARDLEILKASITPLKTASGPVTWWSADQLRTWSHRPWNEDGEQLPLVHHATIGVAVKFRDFGVMSRWVAEHTEDIEGFRVNNFNWALTSKHRDQLTKEVRTNAVRAAVDRAQQYADALGLGTVRPVAIADAGMLGAESNPMSRHGGDFLLAESVGSSSVELQPEDIEVSASVDARFIAGN